MAARWTGCSSGRRAREMRKSKRAAAGDVARDREWMVGATRRHRGRGAGAPGGYKRNAARVTRSTYSSALYVRWLVRGSDEVIVVRSAWHYSTAEISRAAERGARCPRLVAGRRTGELGAAGREGGLGLRARARGAARPADAPGPGASWLVGWLARLVELGQMGRRRGNKDGPGRIAGLG